MSTLRQAIIALLKEREATAREISRAVGIGEKEVYDHLTHIARSKNLEGRFVLIPSACKNCGHIFKKRDRLSPPSRCFLCKSESVTTPRFAIRGVTSPRKRNAPPED